MHMDDEALATDLEVDDAAAEQVRGGDKPKKPATTLSTADIKGESIETKFPNDIEVER